MGAAILDNMSLDFIPDRNKAKSVCEDSSLEKICLIKKERSLNRTKYIL